jgi:hypothetical protein
MDVPTPDKRKSITDGLWASLEAHDLTFKIFHISRLPSWRKRLLLYSLRLFPPSLS